MFPASNSRFRISIPTSDGWINWHLPSMLIIISPRYQYIRVVGTVLFINISIDLWLTRVNNCHSVSLHFYRPTNKLSHSKKKLLSIRACRQVVSCNPAAGAVFAYADTAGVPLLMLRYLQLVAAFDYELQSIATE